MINPLDLSLKLKRLAVWLDVNCQSDQLERKQFRQAPFGSAYVTVDPARQGRAASANYNRVYLCGCEAGLEDFGIARLTDLFVANGVKRFFVWLSPGPDMEVVRGWLAAHGFARVKWTGYPTLCRTDRVAIRFNTDFETREAGPAEIESARGELGDTLWPGYVTSAGKPGFFHYLAFDGDRPVAMAALCHYEDIGYLMAAATAESHRKRGAQQALIARRVERAEQLGCSLLVSETLTMLEHSHRNLQRAGFREVYNKEVYEWNA